MEGEGWGRQSVDRMVGKVEGGWKKEREGGESGGRVGKVFLPPLNHPCFTAAQSHKTSHGEVNYSS